VTLGAALARHDINAVLDGPGADLILNGLYLLGGAQQRGSSHGDRPRQPHCASHEFFNGVLAERAHGVFNGRIIVRPGAQRTDSKQTNNNLLLSTEARADSQPQLEIYADDVKCTHARRWVRSTRCSSTISAAAGSPPQPPGVFSLTGSPRRSSTGCGTPSCATGSTAWCAPGSADARRSPPPCRLPLLAQRENGHPLIYLDNAATTRSRRRCSTPLPTITSPRLTWRGAYEPAIRASGVRGARATPLRPAFVNAAARRDRPRCPRNTEAYRPVRGRCVRER